MKKNYNEVEIKVNLFALEDVLTVTVSGEIDDDETKVPIPEGWGGAN